MFFSRSGSYIQSEISDTIDWEAKVPMSKQQAGKPVLFFLETTQLSVYAPHILNGVSFPFPDGIIRNMEIIDSQKLFEFIQYVIDSQKLHDANVLVVYGQSLYFEKRVPVSTEEKIEEERKRFCHDTPFDRVASKDYKVSGEVSLVSINSDFYDSLKQACTRAEITVIGVIPQFLLAASLPKSGMTPQAVKNILAKLDSFKEQAIVYSKVKLQTLQQHEEYLSSHYSGLIIVIFVLFLLGVFGITGFILRRQFQSTAGPSGTVAPIQLATTIPTSIPSASPILLASSSATASNSAIQIQIQHTSQTASQSALLLQRLTDNGFTNVERRTVSNVATQNPLLMYSASVSADIRSEIIGVVREVLPSVVTQQSNELSADFLIQIGR